MHQAAHVERHFTASDLVRDIVIGMSDGLTVPFALAAGLSGTNALPRLVVTAGLAEVAAGSIAMGLGGYLAAKSDAEHYVSEKRREELEVVNLPDRERDEVADVFREYGLGDDEIEPILRAFENNHPAWVDFMMRFELGLEEPDPRRRTAKCSRDRRRLHRWRPDPAGTVHDGRADPRGPQALNRGHSRGARGLRRDQGTLHWNPTGPKRVSNHVDRRNRCCCCVLDRADVSVLTASARQQCLVAE